MEGRPCRGGSYWLWTLLLELRAAHTLPRDLGAQDSQSCLQIWPEQRFLEGFCYGHLIFHRSRWAYMCHWEPAGLSRLPPGSSKWGSWY